MHEPSGGDHDDSLRQYLLGTLPDESRERLEARFLADEQVFEQLLAAEDELFCDYAQRDLAPADAERFERLFLESPRGQRRLDAARALLAGLVSPRAEAPLRRPWTRRSLWLPAAAAVLLAIGIWRAGQAPEGPGPRARTLPPTPSVTASGVPAGAPPATSRTLTLTPGTQRAAGGVQRLVLPPETNRLRLVLVLPEGVAHGRGRAELRSEEGEPVWSVSDVAVPSARSRLELELPATSLQEGDYQLVLSGEIGGAYEELADYRFTILRD